MSEDQSRKRLGRGLAALIGEIDRPAAPEKPARILRVRADELDWHFAVRRAGLTEIPLIVRDVNDRTALELAIIENVQRADLNPVEEAQGYQQLIDEHGYTQADLGQVIGKSRSHVANTLRLLKLPNVIHDMLVDGDLSAGHARTLVTAEDPAGLAKRIVKEGLSVRQAEALVQMPAGPTPAKAKSAASAPEKDPDTLALEKLMTDTIGMIVSIEHKGKGGTLKVNYRSLDQLDELCRRLKDER
ncbi:MAG: ParB/RepB/Spo0J family partition protein [Mesorhizobium sp.]|nr:MAG: ParB/RepB/Spo0J family partition protein [Mesorhizobium sp.]